MKGRCIHLLWALLSLAGFASSRPGEAISAVGEGIPKGLPLSFEAPRNPSSSSYVARGRDYLISVNGSDLTVGVPQSKESRERHFQIRFPGGRPSAAIPEAQLPGTVNYFIGKDPAKWAVGVPTFERVRYHDLYPGVDVVYYGDQQNLEFDFDVKPGGNPEAIRLKFPPGSKVSLNDGEIVLTAPDGALRLKTPVVYQEINQQRWPNQSRAIPRRILVGSGL